jgi:hypothetical protein
VPPGTLYCKRWSYTVEIFYPVERLFANPRIFFAIANALDGPDGETLKEAFYELMEHGFAEFEDPEDIEFLADEVCFSINPEDGEVQITLNTGLASILKPVEGELKAQITNDHEMAAASAIYDRIVKSIVEANPDFDGDIALCSPPTPGNSYLRSDDGERFEGAFHLLSDPESQFAFSVHIVDVQRDILHATYKPI